MTTVGEERESTGLHYTLLAGDAENAGLENARPGMNSTSTHA